MTECINKAYEDCTYRFE